MSLDDIDTPELETAYHDVGEFGFLAYDQDSPHHLDVYIQQSDLDGVTEPFWEVKIAIYPEPNLSDRKHYDETPEEMVPAAVWTLQPKWAVMLGELIANAGRTGLLFEEIDEEGK
jgi:hypothetical protein